MAVEPDPTGQAPRPRPSRFHHRSRSHESAHADHALQSQAPSFDHPLVSRAGPQLISTADALSTLIDHLRNCGSFAYDSEFIGELTYIPKLCLIQVATSDLVALIDPLVNLDLTPFWNLLCDPSVEKIVHAGQQDVEPVFRHTGRAPANLHDTQIVAGFLSLPYPLALSKVVFEMVGAKLGKGLTFTHWDQRPLSPMQLRYAADDVRYLPAARAEQGRRLAAAGHTAWASEESNNLCDPKLYQNDPMAQSMRIRGAQNLPAPQLAVLRDLIIWRDGGARSADVPPRTFLKDEILLDMARSPVKSVEKLDRVRGLPRPVEQEHGAEMVAVTLRALSLPAAELPRVSHIEPTPPEKFRCDALWSAAQCWCAGRGIDPAIVSSRQEVGDLWRALTHNQDPSELRLMRGWRRAALGDMLVNLMKGQGHFAVSWANGLLQAKA